MDTKRKIMHKSHKLIRYKSNGSTQIFTETQINDVLSHLFDVIVNDLECKTGKNDEKEVNKERFEYYLYDILLIAMYIGMGIKIKINIIRQIITWITM